MNDSQSEKIVAAETNSTPSVPSPTSRSVSHSRDTSTKTGAVLPEIAGFAFNGDAQGYPISGGTGSLQDDLTDYSSVHLDDNLSDFGGVYSEAEIEEIYMEAVRSNNLR